MAMESDTLEVEYFEKLADLKKRMKERPSRKLGVKWAYKRTSPPEFDYDGNLDRFNGYDAAAVRSLLMKMEQGTGERCMIPLDENNSKNANGDDEGNGNGIKVDEEAKVDESKQMDFAQGEKRVRAASGNLHARDDTVALMNAGGARKEVSEDVSALNEEKQLATWGTEIPAGVV